MSSRVAVIGPGRVGTLLAVSLVRAGHRVVAVAGGRPEAREAVTAVVAGVRAFASAAQATPGADLVVLAVPDDAIEPLVRDLARGDALAAGTRVVHVAGSRGLAPLEVARRAGARVAACHPAMTVPAGATDPSLLHGVAWAVTARPSERAWADDLVRDLGGDPVEVAESARVLYHAGLTLASNAAGAAVAAARQALLGAGIRTPETFLAPLVEASVANVLRDGASALTGPVVRGDAGTIAHHLDTLTQDLPGLAGTYRRLTGAVLDEVAPSLPPATVVALRRLLEEST